MQSIGHDLRRGLNNFSLGNNYKSINKWLAELKNIDSSLKTLDKEISADAKLIAAWGSSEGEDLADVTMRMSQLMEEVGLIHQAYSIQHTTHRKLIKSLKTQEMTLDDNRKKKHDLTNQIAKQQKSSKENPIKMMELQSQLERLSAELLQQELDLLQFKRVTIRDAFNQQFEAMIEFSEKMALIAGYGRQITNVIDTSAQLADRATLYGGAEYTAGAINQVKVAVTSWHPQPLGASVRDHITPSQDELALAAAAAAYNNKTPVLGQQYAAGSDYSNGFGTKGGAENDSSNWDDLQMLKLDQSQISLNENGTHAFENWKQETPGNSLHDGPPTPPKTVEASPYIHSLQVNQLQEQQRQLQLEQQRAYQQSVNSYSSQSSPTSGSPSPNPYQSAASVANSLRQSSVDGTNGGLVVGRPFTPTMLRQNSAQDLYGSQGTPSPSYSAYQQHQQQPASYESSVSSAPARGQRLGFVDPRERGKMDRMDRMDNADLYKTEIVTGSIASRFSKTSSIMNEK